MDSSQDLEAGHFMGAVVIIPDPILPFCSDLDIFLYLLHHPDVRSYLLIKADAARMKYDQVYIAHSHLKYPFLVLPSTTDSAFVEEISTRYMRRQHRRSLRENRRNRRAESSLPRPYRRPSSDSPHTQHKNRAQVHTNPTIVRPSSPPMHLPCFPHVYTSPSPRDFPPSPK